MSRRTRAFAAVIILSLVAPVDLAAHDKVGTDGLISRVGTYRLYHGELSLRIYEDKGKLNYEIGRTNMFWSGPAEPIIEKGPCWFALVESPKARAPRAIWIFDGRDLLVQVAYDPMGSRDDYRGATECDSESRPSIVTNAPNAVRDRLPESFKKRFKRSNGPPGEEIPHGQGDHVGGISTRERNNPSPSLPSP